jgi:alpha-galactosidase
VVQGFDKGIYHKAFLTGAWAATWDSPATPNIAATIATPAVVSNANSLQIVVRGTNSELYYASLTFTGTWSGFTDLIGSSLIAPTLVIDSAGTLHLVVRGVDNVVYEKAKTATGSWDATWSSAGGGTLNQPAVVMLGSNVVVVASGDNNQPFYNTFSGTTWSGWISMTGATTLNPSLAIP